MVAEPEPVLVEIRCGWCQQLFALCEAHWRGHLYCSTSCRAKGARRRKREARARHERSEEARLDHRDRQRAYRERQRSTRVTDHGSEKLASPMKSALQVERQLDLFEQEDATHGDAKKEVRLVDEKLRRCVVCGRTSTRLRRPFTGFIGWLLDNLSMPTARGPP